MLLLPQQQQHGFIYLIQWPDAGNTSLISLTTCAGGLAIEYSHATVNQSTCYNYKTVDPLKQKIKQCY